MVALPSRRFNPRVSVQLSASFVSDVTLERSLAQEAHASEGWLSLSQFRYFTSPQSGPRYFPLMVMLRLMVWVPLVVAIFIAPLKALPPESDSTLI